MSGGVCDLPGERCYHPISCEERGCVKQRAAPKPAPITTPPGIMSGAVEGVDGINRIARDHVDAFKTQSRLGGLMDADDALLVSLFSQAILASRTTPPSRSYVDAIEDAAKIAEASAKNRDAQQLSASLHDRKGEARDADSMAMEARMIAAAIRLLSQEPQP